MGCVYTFFSMTPETGQWPSIYRHLPKNLNQDFYSWWFYFLIDFNWANWVKLQFREVICQLISKIYYLPTYYLPSIYFLVKIFTSRQLYLPTIFLCHKWKAIALDLAFISSHERNGRREKREGALIRNFILPEPPKLKRKKTGRDWKITAPKDSISVMNSLLKSHLVLAKKNIMMINF